jgi:serine/threonine protein phosphatase PrpC
VRGPGGAYRVLTFRQIGRSTFIPRESFFPDSLLSVFYHFPTAYPPLLSNVRFTADPVTPRPDVAIVELQPDDEFVVVATDGLWDVFTNQQVVRFVRKELGRGYSLDQVAERLVNKAIEK